MNESRDVFFLQQISADINNQMFKCPFGGVIVKNCDEEGKLLKFKSAHEYKHAGKKLWLYLSLKIFQTNSVLFTAFCCSECPTMKGVDKLKLDTDQETVRTFLCYHSKSIEFLIPNWQEIWQVEIPNTVPFFKPTFNGNLNFQSFTDKNKNTTFLAGVRVDKVPHLIITATARQCNPFCSTCDSSSCIHFKAFESRKDKTHPRINFMCRMDCIPVENERNIAGEDDASIEQNSEAPSSSDNVNEEVIDPTVGEEETDVRHYLHLPPLPLYHKMYGYNFTPILYPFEKSKAQQETWLKRLRNIYDFPDQFIPVWSRDKKCQHSEIQYHFDS